MDKKLEMEILTAVRAAIAKAFAEKDEVWLSPDELCKQFQFISKDFIARYGKLLPRTNAKVRDQYGHVVETHFGYGRNAIQQMIMDGSIQELMLKDGCLYSPSRKTKKRAKAAEKPQPTEKSAA